MDMMKVSKICKALGDYNRLQIIKMLAREELCACQILEEFNITQPTLSHHMQVLSECDLIYSKKDGKWTHYTLNYETLNEYKEFINYLVSSSHEYIS